MENEIKEIEKLVRGEKDTGREERETGARVRERALGSRLSPSQVLKSHH